MLMGALVAFLALPSFTSKSEQKVSSKQTKVVDPDLTTLNLKNTLIAYTSEINANAEYDAYSDKAMREGRQEIALLFKAVSRSSGIQAQNYKTDLLKAGESVPNVKPEFTVKSTKENLKEAIAHETHQVSALYPEFIICANKANHQNIYKSMCCAYMISKKNKAIFEKSLDALEKCNMNLFSDIYFVCPKCGNIYYENTVHNSCPFCGTHYTSFIEISD